MDETSYFEKLKQLLAAAGQGINQNLAESGARNEAFYQQQADRLKMMNPDRAGPHLPDSSPEERQHYDEVANTVAAGTVSPVNKAKLEALQRLAAGGNKWIPIEKKLIEPGAIKSGLNVWKKLPGAGLREEFADYAKTTGRETLDAYKNIDPSVLPDEARRKMLNKLLVEGEDLAIKASKAKK